MKGTFSKTRLGLIVCLFILTFVVFLGRLIFVQVVQGAELRDRARRQYEESLVVRAPRGEIFDCRGQKIAANATFQSLFAYPLNATEVKDAYRNLAYIFNCSYDQAARDHSLKPRHFTWIKRHLSDSELVRYRRKDPEGGLFLRDEPTRVYPQGTVGRGILGFVNLDNCGRSGLELTMDEHLAGSDGRALVQKDGLGFEFPIREIPLRPAVSGESMVLTVDWRKQQIVEEELQRAVGQYNARGGMAVFIDPHSGAILAAADFVLDQPDNEHPMKLCAATDIFEPGSVFKLITAAAALEENRVLPTDTFYAENGLWRLGRRSLRDDHKFEWLTFREAFENSSNIILGKIANQISGDRVMAMARRFGFGQRTRCRLNGESRGILEKPYRWSEYTTSAFAIGHGVSVTAMQLAQAFGVIASGGYLNHPYLVKGCINQEGAVIEEYEPHPIRILDEATVQTLNTFLRGVVQNGTGKPLADAPFAIAGKTGTAEKPNLESGGYFKNKFMATFAGYFPADSPLVAGVVILDEPEPIHYGGWTAGPAFKNIAVRFAAIDNYRMTPTPQNPESEEVRLLPDAEDITVGSIALDDLCGKSVEKVRICLNDLGLTPEFFGTGDEILCTWPAPPARLQPGDTVRCIMTCDEDNPNLPDLTGLTAREAIRVLSHYGIPFQCRGSGRVKKQSIEAGFPSEKSHDLILYLEEKEV